jgi:hypothetical protein
MAPRSLSLLRLPLEVRYEIYSYFCPADPVSYPFPSSPVNSITHRPPPHIILLVCRQFYEEIRTYYYDVATFKFQASGLALGFLLPLVDRNRNSLTSLRAIHQAKNVEVILVWNAADYSTVSTRGLSNQSQILNEWLSGMTDLFEAEGHMLECVTISITEISTSTRWDDITAMLEPLSRLNGKVRFKLGKLIVIDGLEDEIRHTLEEYIKDLNNEGDGGSNRGEGTATCRSQVAWECDTAAKSIAQRATLQQRSKKRALTQVQLIP